MSEAEKTERDEKPKKAESGPRGMRKSADGHWLLHGARWHVPTMGDPASCAVPGCDHVLGAWRTRDPLDDIEANEPDEDDAGSVQTA